MQIDPHLLILSLLRFYLLLIDNILSTSFFLPQAKNILSFISALQIFIISFYESSLKNFPTGPFPEIFLFFSIVK